MKFVRLVFSMISKPVEPEMVYKAIQRRILNPSLCFSTDNCFTHAIQSEQELLEIASVILPANIKTDYRAMNGGIVGKFIKAASCLIVSTDATIPGNEGNVFPWLQTNQSQSLPGEIR